MRVVIKEQKKNINNKKNYLKVFHISQQRFGSTGKCFWLIASNNRVLKEPSDLSKRTTTFSPNLTTF